MPNSDGRSATIFLRNAGYTNPIVALTANATDQERDRCFAAGCNGFLAKPLDQDEFLRTMRRYLRFWPPPLRQFPRSRPAASVSHRFGVCPRCANPSRPRFPPASPKSESPVLCEQFRPRGRLGASIERHAGCYASPPFTTPPPPSTRRRKLRTAGDHPAIFSNPG